jgi:hypothetical protein
MPTPPTSMRLSDEALRLIGKLETFLGLTRTAVVESAIRAFARFHKIK